MKWVPVRLLLIFVAVPATVAMLTGSSLWILGGGLLAYMLAVGWGTHGSATRRRRGPDLSGAAFMLVLFFALPIGLASVTGASWRAIALAYAIWFGLLGLLIVQGLLSRRVTTGEAVGWPFLTGMFLTMGAVPVLSLIVRLTGLA